MSIRSIFFFIFVVYSIFTIACTFRILFRAGIFKSFYDFQHKLFKDRQKLFSLRWERSMFTNIDPDDKMLRFVVFSQKIAPYLILIIAIVMPFLSDDKIL